MTISTIGTELPVGIAGMLADSSLSKDVVSGTSEETVNGILPGSFVVQGTADLGVKQPSAQNQLLKGVAVFGHSYSPSVQVDATTGAYLPGITFDVLRHGRIFALAKATIHPTDHVHVQMIANTGAPVGQIRPDADTGKTVDASDFVKVIESGDNVTSPIVEVDMTNASLATSD